MEGEKIKALLKIKGNVILMGDLNGSETYAEDKAEWRSRGIGSENSESNAQFQNM